MAKMEQQYRRRWDPAMMGITAGFSVGNMKFPVKEESKPKITELRIFK
jgi:hypothetical protein